MKQSNLSLIEMASIGSLPLRQYMDLSTWEWIVSNRPKTYKQVEPPFNKQILDQLLRYVPPKEWFLDRHGCNTIHGYRHIIRVIYHSLVLAKRSGSDKLLKRAPIVAKINDLRRMDDKGDEGHGTRAAEWFVNNKDIVQLHLGIELSCDDLESISTGITLHEVPYETIKETEIYKNNSELVDTIKTADALDRYRLPKLKWWPDLKMLKKIPSNDQVQLAYDLVVASEREYLNGAESANSVTEILRRMYA
jgi:hypothetical protein